MEYITVGEASLKWGIKIRQVQNLCGNGRVHGAIRFNHTWAIPEGSQKPKDGRRCYPEVSHEAKDKTETFSDKLEIFKKIFDQFPYSINITYKDGLMVYANDAFFDGTLEGTRNTALGEYNILQEEMKDKWGLKEHLEKAFRGEQVFTSTLKLAYKDVVDKYGQDYPFICVYQDISSFPIFDDNGQLEYVVSVFIPVRKYMGRDEIVNAREYIENHWKEPLDVKLIAKFVNLSLSHFLRLFHEQTGFSPHEYYIETKMNNIKKTLLDFSLSVSQAFSECGIDYNSYYASLFKKHTGFTPMQYRNNNK